MTSRPDKLAEFAVGHRTGIDKEAIDPHAVRRGLFRVVGIGAHPELAPLDPNHVTVRMRKGGAISGVHDNQS